MRPVTELENTCRLRLGRDFNIYPEERSSVFGPLVIEYNVPGL
jgi:hypothetical protein